MSRHDPLTHDAIDPGRSAGWWADAALLLWRHPLRWGLLGVVVMAALDALGRLPWVGTLATLAATPLVLGGWAHLAHEARLHGTAPGLRGLLAGTRAPHWRPLAVLGAVLVASALLIAAVGQVLGLGAQLGAVGVDPPESLLARAQLGRGMLALLLLLAFSLLVSAALWFAPALVVLRGATPQAAMRASLVAVRDNGLTFLLYAVVQLLLAATATLPEHLGWLLLVPWMLTTTYVSYRDVFEAPAAHLPAV
ncbi:MAG TPA: BPSS1780 family membrane protein [Burkholderiaceae bacterium]|nr:BPSS1780 family membrane protein [Burkholderiaceae bacterium]